MIVWKVRNKRNGLFIGANHYGKRIHNELGRIFNTIRKAERALKQVKFDVGITFPDDYEIVEYELTEKKVVMGYEDL